MVESYKISPIIYNIVRTQLTRPPHLELKAFETELLRLHPEGILGLLFYGSCLRLGCSSDSIADLYVIVKDYQSFYNSVFLSLSNFLLPPNVFYLETCLGKEIIRLKYAVISFDQLKRATSPLWFHSYFWARFCQPMQLIYYQDEKVIEEVTKCICRAIYTFVSRVIPCLDEGFSVYELWTKGLQLTYMAEIRPESKSRAKSIWQVNKACFERITPYVLSDIKKAKNQSISKQNLEDHFCVKRYCHKIFSCIMPWSIRIIIGKFLSVLRLVKAGFTFRGGVDYALWKIERHTGVRIKLGPFLRRHPILAMLLTSWKLLIKKAIR